MGATAQILLFHSTSTRLDQVDGLKSLSLRDQSGVLG